MQRDPQPSTTFQQASRRVTTFQRAALVVESESVTLRPDAISRFLPADDGASSADRWSAHERATLLAEERRRRRLFTRPLGRPRRRS